MTSSTRPNIVSAYLTRQGFTKSTSSSSRIRGYRTTRRGFEVVTLSPGQTRVVFNLGNSMMSVSGEKAREIVSEAMSKMADALDARYTVIRWEPETGHNYMLKILPKN